MIKKLNIEELCVGAFIQFPFYFIIGWWVIPLMIISAILWAVGGSGPKLFRRLGVPIATSLAIVLWNFQYWTVLALFVAPGWGVISIGYGMPDKTDKGSFLGRFYLGQLKNYAFANMATRVTTYMLYWSVMVVVGKVLGVLNLIPILL